MQKKFKGVFNLEEMWINFTLVQIVVENLNKYFGIQATVVHLFFLFHCAVVGLLLLFFVWDFFFSCVCFEILDFFYFKFVNNEYP